MYPGFTYHTEQIFAAVTDEVTVIASSSVLGATMPAKTEVYILTIAPSFTTVDADPEDTGDPFTTYEPIDLIDSGSTPDAAYNWRLWYRNVSPGDPGGGASRYRFSFTPNLVSGDLVFLQLVQYDDAVSTGYTIDASYSPGDTVVTFPDHTPSGPLYDHVPTLSGVADTSSGWLWATTTMSSLAPTLNQAGSDSFETSNKTDMRNVAAVQSGTTVSDFVAFQWAVAFVSSAAVVELVLGGWHIGRVAVGGGW